MTLLDQAEQRLRSGKDDLTAGYGDPQGEVLRAFHQYPVAAASLNTPQSQYIMRQLVAAIEVAAAAEKYALAALGRTVEFSHEDIRALAISGFIQQSREAA